MVVDQVIVHYKRGGIKTKLRHKMAEDVEKLQDEYKNVCKSMNKTKVISLQEKLKKTMPFWTTKILNQMKSDINLNKSMKGKERIKQDLLFLESMM